MIERKEFQLKFTVADGAEGKFTGRASVYGVVDLLGDVVMPGAFAISLAASGHKAKVLNQHNPFDVIGTASLEETDTALEIKEAQLSMGLSSAKDAWIRLKDKLIDGISIGYEVIKREYEGEVRRILEAKLWEVSLVTFPANPFARVTSVKSLAELMDSVKDRKLTPQEFAAIEAGYDQVAREVKAIAAAIERIRPEAKVDTEAEEILELLEGLHGNMAQTLSIAR